MTTALSKFFRALALGMAVFVVVGASYASARAAEVTLSGSTTFINSVPGLTFTGTNFFTGTTALGVGSLSGPNSLGTFFLNTGPLAQVGGAFQLDILFTSPAGINGGQGASYLATIVGTVSPNIDQGGVNVDFLNPTQTFSFNDGVNTGTFSLTVADLFVQTGRTAFLTAGFTGQQNVIPEPTTLLLLGSSLAGIAVKLRQRKRAKEQIQE